MVVSWQPAQANPTENAPTEATIDLAAPVMAEFIGYTFRMYEPYYDPGSNGSSYSNTVSAAVFCCEQGGPFGSWRVYGVKWQNNWPFGGYETLTQLASGQCNHESAPGNIEPEIVLTSVYYEMEAELKAQVLNEEFNKTPGPEFNPAPDATHGPAVTFYPEPAAPTVQPNVGPGLEFRIYRWKVCMTDSYCHTCPDSYGTSLGASNAADAFAYEHGYDETHVWSVWIVLPFIPIL